MVKSSDRERVCGVKVVTPSNVLGKATLTFQDGIIVDIAGQSVKAVQRLIDSQDDEDWLIPGLIDTHVHGAAGADTMDASIEGLKKIAKTLLRFGTTAFLATTMTEEKERLEQSLCAVRKYIDTSQSLKSSKLGIFGEADCLGIHMEGPFIAKDFSGAQRETAILNPSVEDLYRYYEWSGRYLKIFTLAPEITGAEKVVKLCKMLGIIPSAGHTAATWQEARTAVDNGIQHVTHAFNAMRPLHHREPGLIGAALEDSNMLLELIADGIHVHPSTLGLTYMLKGADKIILISDGMRAVGMVDGEYELGGQKIFVRGREARLADGVLAGSTACLLDGVRTMILRVGVPIEQAVRMASYVPARLLGFEEKTGSLKIGREATFLRLDPEWRLKEVWLRGYRLELGG